MENPCCVLTQEMSKKFIQGKDTDKYDFFLKATGLEQMRDDNSAVREQLSATEENVDGFKETLQQKKATCEKHQKDLEDLMSFEEQERDIKKLERKIDWLAVRDEEAALAEMDEQLDTLKQNTASAQEELAELESAGKQEADVETLRNDAQEATASIRELDQEDAQIQQQLKAFNKRIAAQEGQCKELQEGQRDTARRLKDVREDIRGKKAKAMAEGVDSEQNLLKQVEVIERNIGQSREAEAQARMDQARAREEREDLKAEGDQSRQALRSYENAVSTIKEEIQRLSGAEGQTRRFGEAVPNILREAQGDRRLASSLKGPVGNYIKIKPGCERYEAAIERGLIGVIFNFVVTTDEARNAAIALIKHKHRHSGDVITAYGTGRGRYPVRVIPGSLLDMIVIDDDHIFNVVIDAIKPETVIMAKNEQEVRDRYTRQKQGRGGLEFNVPGIFRAICEDCTTVSYSRGGNKSSETYRQACRRLLVQDMTEVIRTKRETLRQKEAELAQKKDELPDTKMRITQIDASYQNAERTLKTAAEDIKKLNRSKVHLQQQLREVEESRAIDTSHLEGEEVELSNLVAQMEGDLREQTDVLRELKRENDKLKRGKEDIAAKKRDKQQVFDDIQKRINSAIQRHDRQKAQITKAKTLVDTNTNKSEIFAGKCDKQRAKRDKVLQEASEKTRDSVEGWDGLPLPLDRKDSVQTINKTIEAKMTALAKSECFYPFQPHFIMCKHLLTFPYPPSPPMPSTHHPPTPPRREKGCQRRGPVH